MAAATKAPGALQKAEVFLAKLGIKAPWKASVTNGRGEFSGATVPVPADHSPACCRCPS